jgi:hypothetical protein
MPVAPPQRAEPAAGLQQIPQLSGGRALERWRGDVEQRRKESTQLLECIAEFGIASGVRFGQRADGFHRARAIGVQPEGRSVRGQRNHPRLRA